MITESFEPRRLEPKGYGGRRVGGVPRSSLKGKETQHDEGEKNTSKPQKPNKKPTKQEPQNKHNQKARGRIPLI